MNIEIICPLYKAENYIVDLDNNIKKQKNVNIKKISYVLTESSDNTEKLLKRINATYSKLKKEEFSHSTARENVAKKSDADIVVFITQDIDIRNNDWLEKLVNPIINGESEASFSRQVTKYNNIEKYTREKNYPDKSFINTKADIKEKGLKTFFFSDASSAIKTEIFKKLNGYDGKRLVINEDMYIAYKLITNGYKIKYCSDSVVYHSHKFTFKEIYKRYYDTGVFFKENSYIDKYGTNKAGGGMALYILKRAIQERNIPVLFEFLPNMLARFLGMKMGKLSVKNESK